MLETFHCGRLVLSNETVLSDVVWASSIALVEINQTLDPDRIAYYTWEFFAQDPPLIKALANAGYNVFEATIAFAPAEAGTGSAEVVVDGTSWYTVSGVAAGTGSIDAEARVSYLYQESEGNRTLSTAFGTYTDNPRLVGTLSASHGALSDVLSSPAIVDEGRALILQTWTWQEKPV
jgi:hypothetical protein